MKICIISFDLWEYDSHILKTLRDKNIEANHIVTGKFKYKYPTPLHRVSNFFSKLLFKKNIKKIKQRQFILDELERMGPQDKILVINPELIPVDIHKKIRTYTKEYIAYLYDSSKRCPVEHLLDGLFDKIYSFDADDVVKFNFIPVTNYIYHDKKAIKPAQDFAYRVFMILSVDNRLPVLTKIADELDRINISYKFMLVGAHKPAALHPNISYQKKIIPLKQLEQYLEDTEMFLDIIRKEQTGLSFRVFESLAYQKKLITTNPDIKNYDFYNPNNILVVDPDNVMIDPAFFTTPYEPLSENVYNKYTLSTWVDTVFSLPKGQN